MMSRKLLCALDPLTRFQDAAVVTLLHRYLARLLDPACNSFFFVHIVWTPASRGETADKMPREFNWHIKRPQYGSRRLALKNHVVAAVGEVSATDLTYGDRFRS